MSDNSVSRYSIKMSVGGRNFSNHLRKVTIFVSKDQTIQIIKLIVDLTREQYNKDLLPYKDKIKLEITSSKGIKSDGEPPNVDASFSYFLTVLEESSSQSNTQVAGNISPSSPTTLTCLPAQTFKAHQKIIKNKVFVNKSRKAIIDEILSGSEHVLQSEIYHEGELIDQIFMPPLRQVGAIRHLDHYVNLFKDGDPDYINYSIDGKIYLGSCINNNMKPLKIYYSSDNDTLNKTFKIMNKSSSNYDYIVQDAIQESKNYNSLCAAIGKKQTFNFSPMNKFFSRVTRDLNEYDNSLGLSNGFGDDINVGKHVQKTNVKQTWYKNHTGLPIITSDKENGIFPDAYVSNSINQSVKLKMKLNSAIKFKDFLYVGRLIKLSCDLNAY